MHHENFDYLDIIYSITIKILIIEYLKKEKK